MADDSTRPTWPFKHVTTLTPHPGGSWCKKVRGDIKYFGPWRNPDPDDKYAKAALERYLAFAQADQHGFIPPTIAGDVTVSLIVNHWLTDRKEAVARGELTARQFVAYRKIAKKAEKELGEKRSISSIGPAEMKVLRDSFKGGPAWIGSQVRWARGMFNWGAEYYGVRPRYGGAFSSPPKSSVRKARREFKPFTRAEIRKILKVATPAVRAFVLLGLNCGFGQTDCARLTVAAVDFKKRIIHYPRGKTGVERRCPLWPETIKALRAYKRPNNAHPELFFVTRFGKPYINENRHNNDVGQLVRVVRTDSVIHEFGLAQQIAAGGKSRYEVMKLAKEQKANKEEIFRPRGFYILRHMFRSLAEGTGKLTAIRVIMGQSFSGMDEYYLHLKVGKYRDLKKVTDAVREWLF